MDELVVRTTVYAAPADVYEFLLDFPRYDRYSEYLDRVERLRGDGGPGTEYALRFAWWKLGYTARSEVTDVEAPTRIDWRVTKDIDAHGCCRIEPTTVDPETADATIKLPDDADPDAAAIDACEVSLEIRFDPDSASADAVDLPPLASFDWVLKKAIPLIKEEAERVVERAVADLEGSGRPVSLDVRVDSDRI